MTNNKVEVSLLTSNKSGILSSIIVKAASLGLMYRRNHLEKLDDQQCHMTLYFDGELNCSKGVFIDVMEAHSEIHSVSRISLGDPTVPTSTSTSNTVIPTPAAASVAPKKPAPTTNATPTSLRAHDTISPEALRIAEESLASLLGPVAPMLVESAAAKTKHIGDLFLMLSDELDADERTPFLGLVSGLDLGKLR